MMPLSTLLPSLVAFAVFTLLLGGGAAFLTGRTLANSWRAPVTVVFAAVPLAAAARFLHATLAGEQTDAVKALLTFGLMAAFTFVGFTLRRRRQMLDQYPWLAHGGRAALQSRRDLAEACTRSGDRKR